jgi:hypothetical protein
MNRVKNASARRMEPRSSFVFCVPIDLPHQWRSFRWLWILRLLDA